MRKRGERILPCVNTLISRERRQSLTIGHHSFGSIDVAGRLFQSTFSLFYFLFLLLPLPLLLSLVFLSPFSFIILDKEGTAPSAGTYASESRRKRAPTPTTHHVFTHLFTHPATHNGKPCCRMRCSTNADPTGPRSLHSKSSKSKRWAPGASTGHVRPLFSYSRGWSSTRARRTVV